MASSAPSPTIAERAFLRTLQMHRGTPALSLWEVFSPSWRDRLRLAWLADPLTDPGAAREQLVREHRAQSRPDLGRVHPSWSARALLEERPSVRRAVASQVPSATWEALLPPLGLTPSDLAPDLPPHSEILAMVRTIWSDRLVGDVAERPDDPPVVVALAQLDMRSLLALIQATGLAKWSLARDTAPGEGAPERARFDSFREGLKDLGPAARLLAEEDLAAVAASEQARTVEALGLLSVARLLTGVEPYRARWALQHIPYDTARSLRARLTQKSARDAAARAVESSLFLAAWQRLKEEGRLGADGGTEF